MNNEKTLWTITTSDTKRKSIFLCWENTFKGKFWNLSKCYVEEKIHKNISNPLINPPSFNQSPPALPSPPAFYGTSQPPSFAISEHIPSPPAKVGGDETMLVCI